MFSGFLAIRLITSLLAREFPEVISARCTSCTANKSTQYLTYLNLVLEFRDFFSFRYFFVGVEFLNLYQHSFYFL